MRRKEVQAKKTACSRLCGGKDHGKNEVVSKGLCLGKESEEKSGARWAGEGGKC